MSVLEKIGNTPLKELTAVKKEYGCVARIFAKLENENYGGSIKDRVALAIVENALQTGRLIKGGTVIEATSGNTGIGLSFVCKEKGCRAVIVMPDSMSVERRQMIEKFGGEVVLTKGALGMQGAVDKAIELQKNTPNSFIADQFNNPVCWQAHYQTTAEEILAQTQKQADIFVACVGTGGTLTGVGKRLKEVLPNVKVVAVEPEKSPLLSKGVAGAHAIQGIGANFVPSVLDRTVYDEVLTVKDEDAFAYMRALQKTENLFVGISSGAALAAAVRLAKLPENKGKKILTIFPDSFDRYGSI